MAGIIPSVWRKYTVPAGLTVIQWITDFSLRIKQLQAIVQASQGSSRELKVLRLYILLTYLTIYNHEFSWCPIVLFLLEGHAVLW